MLTMTTQIPATVLQTILNRLGILRAELTALEALEEETGRIFIAPTMHILLAVVEQRIKPLRT
jgi:hypothetical protein